MPLLLKIEEERTGKKKGEMNPTREEEEEEQQGLIRKISWDEDARATIQGKNRSNGGGIVQNTRSVDENWRKLKEMVQRTLIFKKGKKKKKRRIGYKDWWNRSCTKKKREVKRRYKRWRIGKGSKEQYIEEKKKLRELFLKRRKEKGGGRSGTEKFKERKGGVGFYK